MKETIMFMLPELMSKENNDMAMPLAPFVFNEIMHVCLNASEAIYVDNGNGTFVLVLKTFAPYFQGGVAYIHMHIYVDDRLISEYSVCSIAMETFTRPDKDAKDGRRLFNGYHIERDILNNRRTDNCTLLTLSSLLISYIEEAEDDSDWEV